MFRSFLSTTIAFTLLAHPAASQSLQDFAVATYNADRADTEGVRAIQQELAAQGYYSGPIDGIWGPGTSNAANAFIGDLNAGNLDRQQGVMLPALASSFSSAGSGGGASATNAGSGGNNAAGGGISSAGSGGGASATDAGSGGGGGFSSVFD
jgi:hypothetical protein